jgi:aspartyl-tRNA(Asn)/glutamyl-tRNA(Gln) amidotransferase subunit A
MSLTRFAKTYLANQSKYSHLNAFVTRVDPSSIADRQEPSPHKKDAEANLNSLRGMPIAVKDNICTKELKTTAASGILKDYSSPYDATVVQLLQHEGAVIVGKTNMDEFGMGSHSIHSHAGPVKLARYEGEEASAGGSSGGSALAVASAQCWAALGTDTGGSVRLPAAYTGVVGFKPSYGLLSRRGVVAYANSLDTVGILSKSARDVENIFDKLNIHDPQDPTSLPLSTRLRLGSDKKIPKSLRIGIPLDYNIASLHPAVRNTWTRALRTLSERGHSLHPVRLPATQHALSAYYVLAPAEASSNLAKYDGVRYGSRAEGIDGTPENVLFAKTRGQGFGSEVQRRILLGAFSLSAQAIDNYFIQAQKVRRLVQQDFNNVFAKINPIAPEGTASNSVEEKVDILLCPTAPTLAPSLSDVTHQDPLQAYMIDVFTVPASLAGLPAISVPVHISKEERAAIHGEQDFEESAGIQIIGQYGADKLVLDAAQTLQEALPTVQVKTVPHMTAWGASSYGKATNADIKINSHVALELGISVAEAKPIAKQRHEEQIAKALAILLEAQGREHLDKVAAIYGMSFKTYVTKFAYSEDPIQSEKTFSKEALKWKGKVEARQAAKRVATSGSTLTVKEARRAALTPDWHKMLKIRKEDSIVRFVGFGPRVVETDMAAGAEKLRLALQKETDKKTKGPTLEEQYMAPSSDGKDEKSTEIRFVAIDDAEGKHSKWHSSREKTKTPHTHSKMGTEPKEKAVVEV